MTSLFLAVILTAIISAVISSVHALGGSSTTVSVTYDGGTPTVCGIVAGQPSQRIQCYRNGEVRNIFSNISFESIAGGRNVFCGVRSGGTTLVCWNTSFVPKRIYYNQTMLLRVLTIGDTQICAVTNSSNGNVKCWRNTQPFASQNHEFSSISSGLGVTCGVTRNSTRGIVCFGTNSVSANAIECRFMNLSMLSISVGGNHACGLDTRGVLVCRGDNFYGQIDVPDHSAFEFSALALGANHTCALRRVNNYVVCWGGRGGVMNNYTDNVSFETIVAGLDFTCGLTTSNFSVICWGEGWFRNSNLSTQGFVLPLNRILPGPCVRSDCSCGIYPESSSLCSGYGSICRPCDITNLVPPIPSLVPPPPSSPDKPRVIRSKRLTKGLLAFAIVGSVGAVAGICTIIYCLWTGICFGKKKIHNSVQPTVNGSNRNAPQHTNGSPPSRSATIRRQLSRGFRRQRSGTSSKQTEKEEEFTFADLALATNDFARENKIGAGSFGIVYRGKLLDGREVAIKRGEISDKMKKFQEKESAFDSELAFLSRLNHKHLVRLVGYCQERDERLLVYDYMKNGALFDHLHSKKNTEKSSSMLNSWKMRIKIALDAARGIDYLHNYAVPPVIHRDIKSSNILLDVNWVARVSDFGLSLMGPVSDREFRPTKAAGTVGYIDPEYYGLNVLTAKSDVYGLGVVLLELLTGRRAIFKSNEINGGAPISLVDYAVPIIMAGELEKILDKRVGPPEVNETEAVELMAYTALHCVHSEGIYRPTMNDIVANLERALGLCSDSHGSISSGVSLPSD